MLVWECWLDGVAPPPTVFQPGNWVPTAPGSWDSINGEYTNCTSDLILTSLESTIDVGSMLYFTITIKVLESLASTAKITIYDQDNSVSSSVDISGYAVGSHKIVHSVHNPMLLFAGNIRLELTGIAPCTVTIKEILYSYDKLEGQDPGGDPEIDHPVIVSNVDKVTSCTGFDPDYIQFCGSTDGLPIVTGGDPYCDNVVLLVNSTTYTASSSGPNFTNRTATDFFPSKLTIDGYISMTNIDSSTKYFWNISPNDFPNGIYFAVGSTTGLAAYVNGTSVAAVSPRILVNNTIYHIELDVDFTTGNAYLFIDGILERAVNGVPTTVRTGTVTVYPNQVFNLPFESTRFAGIQQNFRITKGILRHTTNFTKPSYPFDSYTYVEPTNTYEGTWKLYHSENGTDYTQFYDSVEPYVCTSVDLPILDDTLIFNSPPFPVLISESILVSATLLSIQLMNTVTTEALDVSAQLVSGTILKILATYSYYQPEALDVSASLLNCNLTTVQSFISYSYYQPEALDVSASLLNCNLTTVQSFISYPYYQSEALDVSALLIGGTLV